MPTFSLSLFEFDPATALNRSRRHRVRRDEHERNSVRKTCRRNGGTHG
jgi:hypothetical protein